MSSTSDVYLAGRYSRRKELLQYAEQLTALGYRITSGWLDGHHESATVTDDGRSIRGSDEDRRRFALEDLGDLNRASILISFTEPEGQKYAGRGGRHVEFGYALALGLICHVVGHRENVFHNMRQVRFSATWKECLAALEREKGEE